MKTSNVVFYAVSHEGERRPLFSATAGEPSAQTVMRANYHTSQAFRAADQKGVPHPEIVCVLETRTGGDNVEKTANFVRLDPFSLRAEVEGDKGTGDLETLFKKEEV